MKASLVYAFAIVLTVSAAAFGQSTDSVQKMEASGDTVGARNALARAAQASPNNIQVWTSYAEFLDRYGDPGARDAYEKVLSAMTRAGGDGTHAAAVARRLAVLDLVYGDRGAATRNLDAARSSGGKTGALGS